ncbi:hypothetical protein WJX74_002142 [Apatococcus lobatus]|uniref:Uncharacterized protein n=1 Tax=Apatococcus lobatus TaxID=904363 RepID=A0AAW1QDG0_9CHLO
MKVAQGQGVSADDVAEEEVISRDGSTGGPVARGTLFRPEQLDAAAAGPKDLSSSLQSSQNALSNLLGSSSMDDDADPWTLYGTSRKKYAIEKRDGEKILSRRKGFTVDTCTSGIAANQESPSFQGASTSEKLSMLDWQSCSRAEAPDLKQACVQTCGEACASGIKQYEERSLKASGLRMSTEDRSRLERSCNRQCPYQCNKPGQQYGFVVPFRR